MPAIVALPTVVEDILAQFADLFPAEGLTRRWTGMETFHRVGKQQLGMDDYQLRNSQGQTRHIYLVFLVYT